MEVTTSGTGQSSRLSSISLPGISDTNSFNLTTQNKASETLTQLESILQNLATERAKIGSNVSIMEGQLDFMANRGSTYTSSLSRLEDVQFDEESTKLARAKLLQDFNLTMISQANQISGTISQILLQWNSLSSFLINQEQVSDTCLKTDERHDAAGTTKHHGGYIPCH